MAEQQEQAEQTEMPWSGVDFGPVKSNEELREIRIQADDERRRKEAQVQKDLLDKEASIAADRMRFETEMMKNPNNWDTDTLRTRFIEATKSANPEDIPLIIDSFGGEQNLMRAGINTGRLIKDINTNQEEALRSLQYGNQAASTRKSLDERAEKLKQEISKINPSKMRDERHWTGAINNFLENNPVTRALLGVGTLGVSEFFRGLNNSQKNARLSEFQNAASSFYRSLYSLGINQEEFPNPFEVLFTKPNPTQQDMNRAINQFQTDIKNSQTYLQNDLSSSPFDEGGGGRGAGKSFYMDSDRDGLVENNEISKQFIEDSDKAGYKEDSLGMGAGEGYQRFEVWRKGRKGDVSARNRMRATQWEFRRNNNSYQWQPRETAAFIAASGMNYDSQHDLATQTSRLSEVLNDTRARTLNILGDEYNEKGNIGMVLEDLATTLKKAPGVSEKDAEKILTNIIYQAEVEPSEGVVGAPFNKLGPEVVDEYVTKLLNGESIGDVTSDPRTFYDWQRNIRAWTEDTYGKGAKSSTNPKAEDVMIYKSLNKVLTDAKSQFDDNWEQAWQQAANDPNIQEKLNESGGTEITKDMIMGVKSLNDANTMSQYLINGNNLANATMDMDNSIFAKRIDSLATKVINANAAKKGGIWGALGFINNLTGFSEIASEAMSSAMSPIRDRVRTTTTNFLSNILPEDARADSRLSPMSVASEAGKATMSQFPGNPQAPSLGEEATRQNITGNSLPEQIGGGKAGKKHFMDELISKKTEHYLWK